MDKVELSALFLSAPVRTQSPSDIERGGRIGARVLVADAQGTLAYVGQGATLVVLVGLTIRHVVVVHRHLRRLRYNRFH